MSEETKDIILRLKKVREEKHLSYSDILSMLAKNNDFLSKSTLSRVFAPGSEYNTFSYETLRPLTKAMLDHDTRLLFRYKDEEIERLERHVSELEQSLMQEQKNKMLLEATLIKDSQYKELLGCILSCICRQISFS